MAETEDAQRQLGNLLREITNMRETLLRELHEVSSERDKLTSRIEEIQLALQNLPEGAKTAAVKLDPLSEPGGKPTAPEIILLLLDDGKGLTGPQIVAAGKRQRPDLEPAAWYAALYRLEGRGDITSAGPRGAKVYQLTSKVDRDVGKDGERP